MTPVTLTTRCVQRAEMEARLEYWREKRDASAHMREWWEDAIAWGVRHIAWLDDQIEDLNPRRGKLKR